MKTLLTLALAALLTAGCGHKGSLYLEDGDDSAARAEQEREDEADGRKREDDK